MKSDEGFKKHHGVQEIRQIERIYEEYGARIYGFCYRLCGDASDAEDLTAEVFLAVCKGLSRFQNRSRVKTWLFKIALNKYRDLAESRKLSTVPLEDAELGSVSHTGDMSIVLEAAMSRLSETEREAVLLVKVEGLKYHEAARILEVPQGTVQFRVHQGVERLRRLCGQGGLL